ncbi:Cell wall-associated hydrolase, NlpC family [Parafrankia irregularis]|uniref:Cell wall-associated hydrolase, NlpC family n=1 Tax=Parafrankia irregularis TaxID=795642 RepID=A0A0S4QVH7_9ACTN|nr:MULTISPECIES: C40 family peptidase [Parafrankia]MBE3201912.1 C40 family peptidase [Parafrankia sp. CH37]CUU59501.1 Cell wall-associated hydrolase, NlpC family [Parafrankia irregularis]
MPRRGIAWLPEDWDQFVKGRQRSSNVRSGTGSRRGGQPPRRAATIAAFTTGTLAASTAAFAATVPSTPDTSASLEPGTTQTASVLPGQGQSSPEDEASAAAAAAAAPLAGAIAASEPIFTNIELTTDGSTVAPNAPVVLTVRAREASGTPLGNQQVRVVVVNGPKWQTTRALTTDANGQAQITARLLSTTTITAVFDGTSALRPSVATSATITIKAPTTTSSSRSSVSQAIPSVIPGSSIGEKAVYLASLQKGKPYVWGAEGPYSFDCSGLVQYVFKQLGRSLPRTAQGQYNASTHVPQSGKQPGDLIFYGTENNIYHVGIYAGNGYMWAAPQTGGVVSLRPIYSSTYKVGRIM